MTAAVFDARGYPERDDTPGGKLEKLLTELRYLTGRVESGKRRLARIVDAVAAQAETFQGIPDAELRTRAAALRPQLRRKGFDDLELVAQAFALVREASVRAAGMRHFDVQLIGGWAMLRGMVAEMDTGEGKTLTATLSAATAALAGRAVHVVTVNDYLAERDAAQMTPVYKLLGLSVGCVKQGQQPPVRRAAYACDVTYCSNKEIAFDYLRDRLVLGGKPHPIALRLGALAGGGAGGRLLLRGLQFAIVDEADSVLVDEARTPLILSAGSERTAAEKMHRDALEIAGSLGESDYRIGEEGIEITDAGQETLERVAKELGGIWKGPRRREQLVRQALTALHVFQRDKHYLVREGKVQIIDEYTGRLMPDRSWERGLHQLIEMKEGVEVTAQRETLARISYQRFFRRYIHLCGMTGTAAEIAGELRAVYRLRVARIPTNRPSRRVRHPARHFGPATAKWQAVVEAIVACSARGQPVLVGTRSVGASELLAKLLQEKNIPFRLLNARQDRDEAEIVARAGERGCVTVATNMAGRGTDIKLAPGVLELGGLHVVATELHDAARIDRQLFGRCGRQGDPGSYEVIVALEDDLVKAFAPLAYKMQQRFGRLPAWLGAAVFRLAQWRAERSHSRARRDLLDLDEYLGDILAFSGRGE
ncbi:MAG TPA: preprotein translocase subunit SecA [Burkholderiales bacterium]|nr:preprotein translocase subunit SecA [Burkholderiales bacterium]